MKPTVIIIDDHRLVAEGCRRLLEDEFEVAGVAYDGNTGVNLVKRLRPQVVLLDISMPDINGLEVARKIRADSPETKVIFVTMQASKVYVEEALRAGARGYVLKQSAATDLVYAIREALVGRRFLPSSIQHARKWEAGPEGSAKQIRLTPRQRQVLQLAAEGRSMKEIAGILHISPKTVEFHKANLMRDLGLRNSSELIRFALEHQLTDNNGTEPRA